MEEENTFRTLSEEGSDPPLKVDWCLPLLHVVCAQFSHPGSTFEWSGQKLAMAMIKWNTFVGRAFLEMHFAYIPSWDHPNLKKTVVTQIGASDFGLRAVLSDIIHGEVYSMFFLKLKYCISSMISDKPDIFYSWIQQNKNKHQEDLTVTVTPENYVFDGADSLSWVYSFWCIWSMFWMAVTHLFSLFFGR